MNYNVHYIINRKHHKAKGLETIKKLLKDYTIQEVIKGPKWLKPSIYFYMVEK